MPLVAKALSSKGYSVLVLTERHKSLPLFSSTHNLSILRILPIRDNRGSTSKVFSTYLFILTYIVIYAVGFTSFLFRFRYLHLTRYVSPLIIPLLSLWQSLGGNVVYDCRTGTNSPSVKRDLTRLLHNTNAALANSLSSFQLLHELTVPKSRNQIFNMTNPLPAIPHQDLVDYRLKTLNTTLIPDTYLISVGTLSKRKNTLLLAEAFAYLQANSSDSKVNKAYLLLVGRCDLTTRQLLRLSSLPRVLYIGEVSHTVALSLTLSSLGHILLSESEGIPRAALEALSLNVPCLLPDTVPEFVHYCSSNTLPTSHLSNQDIPLIARHISSLLTSPSQFLYGQRSFPINQYTTEAYANQLDKIY